ncbi:MAG: hypothetical protein AAGA29_07190 [Planctomycetota bacterium]
MEQILNDDFRDMICLLNEEQVDYLLIGGWAVSFHARFRATEDIDFWVSPTPENAARIMRALIRFGAPLKDVDEDDFALPRFGLQLGRPPARIDILTTFRGVAFSEAWSKRVVETIEGLPVNVVGRDHLLLNKLEVGRAKDLADAEAIQKAAEREKGQ